MDAKMPRGAVLPHHDDGRMTAYAGPFSKISLIAEATRANRFSAGYAAQKRKTAR